MEISLPHQHEPISFRFFADFEIKINSAEATGFTSQQRGLLDAIAASPPMMRQVARMALETDLADVRGRHLTNVFRGPDNERHTRLRSTVPLRPRQSLLAGLARANLATLYTKQSFLCFLRLR